VIVTLPPATWDLIVDSRSLRMCGICGIINKDGTAVPPELIRRMNDLVAHRGPDGAGTFHAPGFALGHRRLAILDLNPRGAQPMAWGPHLQIVFNGEIYNYLEIRAELEALGRRFRTETDTEVILAAYEEWGPACLDRFNGMWAFAIHDARDQSLFLARDRFGVKPLYFTDQPDCFAFSSEIRQLLPLLPTVEANAGVLLEWIATSFENHREETMFVGVRSLPAGHHMRLLLRSVHPKPERWYRIREVPDVERASDVEVADRVRDLLQDAVRLRLRSDVRVGTCLSGGLDSSAVSTIAARLYRDAGAGRFLAVHAQATEADIDESRWARLVADREQMDLSIVTPTTSDFAATIDEVVFTQEEPFLTPSMFMGWHVFRDARARSCPVMLNGQGADEVLLGYERYFTAATLRQPWWRKIRSALLEARHSRLSLLQALQYKAYFGMPGVRRSRLRRRSFLRSRFLAETDFGWVDRAANAYTEIGTMQRQEIVCWQLPKLLRYEDRNSMRHSIETRLPFLDYRVVELAVSLPIRQKIRDGWTKYSLRTAMKGLLPDEVLWRTDKVGFESPTQTWMREHLPRIREEIGDSSILRTVCDHDALMRRLPEIDATRQWQFFNLACWERIFGVRWRNA